MNAEPPIARFQMEQQRGGPVMPDVLSDSGTLLDTGTNEYKSISGRKRIDRRTTNSCNSLDDLDRYGRRLACGQLPDCNHFRDDLVFQCNRNIIVQPQAFRTSHWNQQFVDSFNCCRTTYRYWNRISDPWICTTSAFRLNIVPPFWADARYPLFIARLSLPIDFTLA